MAKTTTKTSNGANLGFEQTLWKAADKLRGSMDPSEYKHVVLGLMFLKYISDGFEEQYQKLVAQKASGADPEDRDEYRAENVFWVPQNARWTFLQNNAKQPTIGRLIDDAMDAIEKENPSLKGVLPKDFARPSLDKTRLGELIDILASVGLGTKEQRSKDTLGRVYEYFLSQFASAEGKKGGEFYTPRSVVRILVEMLAPYKGRVYDPCCGTGGMFVQSEEFILAHGESKDALSIYGQESNNTTWRLAKMNLAIRGISNNLGSENADSFHRDLHPDLKADYILANPPFNMSDWGGDRLRDDKRWVYGIPPAGNANYAWIQHFIHHLAPGGVAGFVMANGSLSSNNSGEGEIRKAMLAAGLVDCIIAMPGQMFYTTSIPVCLWFISRKDQIEKSISRKDTLIIDARKLGVITNRKYIEFTELEVKKISDTFHIWKSGERVKEYRDEIGFCKSVSFDEIQKNNFVLSPGRYIESYIEDDDDNDNIPFTEQFSVLTEKLMIQIQESDLLNTKVINTLTRIAKK